MTSKSDDHGGFQSLTWREGVQVQYAEKEFQAVINICKHEDHNS